MGNLYPNTHFGLLFEEHKFFLRIVCLIKLRWLILIGFYMAVK